MEQTEKEILDYATIRHSALTQMFPEKNMTTKFNHDVMNLMDKFPEQKNKVFSMEENGKTKYFDWQTGEVVDSPDCPFEGLFYSDKGALFFTKMVQVDGQEERSFAVIPSHSKLQEVTRFQVIASMEMMDGVKNNVNQLISKCFTYLDMDSESVNNKLVMDFQKQAITTAKNVHSFLKLSDDMVKTLFLKDSKDRDDKLKRLAHDIKQYSSQSSLSVDISGDGNEWLQSEPSRYVDQDAKEKWENAVSEVRDVLQNKAIFFSDFVRHTLTEVAILDDIVNHLEKASLSVDKILQDMHSSISVREDSDGFPENSYPMHE